VDTTRPALGPLIAGALVVAGTLTASIAWSTLPAPGTVPSSSASVSAPAGAPDPRHGHALGYAVWGSDHRGAPLRWDACEPIRLVLSEPEAPGHAVRDLTAAMSILREATGLDLQLVGTTDERPRVDRSLVENDGTGWRWRPVLIAWAQPGEGGVPLTSLDRGVALPVSVRDGGHEAYVTGQVVINAARADLVDGFVDRRDAIGATLLHELGHLLGLAHVDDLSQLMSTDPGSGPVVLGAGDRAGLRAIGAEGGCNTAPSPEAGRRLVGTVHAAD
jgi:hypothetical protein